MKVFPSLKVRECEAEIRDAHFRNTLFRPLCDRRRT
nr:MAG TPA: hypothetical protein [Caudoviricetes sp.]